MYVYYYETKIGRLGIVDSGKGISQILFNYSTEDLRLKETETIKKVIRQLNEYFEKKRKTFDVETNLKGSEFQKKVWMELLKIPYGKTCSYKDIACAIGNSNASRAVGLANNKNPIPIIIPCHRVIGSDGNLKGYVGGLSVKEKLLDIETRNFSKNCL